MKKYLKVLLFLIPLCLVILCSCKPIQDSSIKSITRPYVAQYECIEAKLGETNLLDDYEYVRIILLDNSDMELNYKQKNRGVHSANGKYSFDEETHEITAEIGILGYTFKEKTIIENGEFLIKKTVRNRELVMKFKNI